MQMQRIIDTGLGTHVDRVSEGSATGNSVAGPIGGGQGQFTLTEKILVDGELDCDASREIVLHQRVWQFSGLISMPVQAGGGPFASNRVP